MNSPYSADLENRELVIRITFRSGSVSEERGTEEQAQALFDGDPERLIDYVLTLNPASGEFALWCHEEDERWDDFEAGWGDPRPRNWEI